MAALPLASIKTSPNRLQIVNQLLLPHVIEFIDIKTIEDAHDAIKTMKVRPVLS
jgi:Predicted translation initiation factor 2B subunit, eIF-2B alpha/beta/delta family